MSVSIRAVCSVSHPWGHHSGFLLYLLRKQTLTRLNLNDWGLRLQYILYVWLIKTVLNLHTPMAVGWETFRWLNAKALRTATQRARVNMILTCGAERLPVRLKHTWNWLDATKNKQTPCRYFGIDMWKRDNIRVKVKMKEHMPPRQMLQQSFLALMVSPQISVSQKNKRFQALVHKCTSPWNSWGTALWNYIMREPVRCRFFSQCWTSRNNFPLDILLCFF